MNAFRRSLTVVALLASVAGFQAAAVSATSAATLSPPTRSVTGCCYVFFAGHWICVPC